MEKRTWRGIDRAHRDQYNCSVCFPPNGDFTGCQRFANRFLQAGVRSMQTAVLPILLFLACVLAMAVVLLTLGRISNPPARPRKTDAL